MDLVTSVLIPILLGTIVGALIPKQIAKIQPILAPVAIICLGGLMANSMALGAQKMLQNLIALPFIFLGGVIYGFIAIAIGYWAPLLIKLPDAQRRAVTFENCVENVSLTQTIISAHFIPLNPANALMLIMPVVYGKWQQIMCAILVLPAFQRKDTALAKKQANE